MSISIRKRALSLLLAVAMTMGLGAPFASAAESVGRATLSVGAPMGELEAGDVVTATVRIPAFEAEASALSLRLDFAGSLLECTDVSYTAGADGLSASVSSVDQANANGYVGLALESSANVSFTGATTLTATFEVTDGAHVASYDPAISVDLDSYSVTAFDAEGTAQSVDAPQFAQGASSWSATVKDGLPFSVTDPDGNVISDVTVGTEFLKDYETDEWGNLTKYTVHLPMGVKDAQIAFTEAATAVDLYGAGRQCDDEFIYEKGGVAEFKLSDYSGYSWYGVVDSHWNTQYVLAFDIVESVSASRDGQALDVAISDEGYNGARLYVVSVPVGTLSQAVDLKWESSLQILTGDRTNAASSTYNWNYMTSASLTPDCENASAYPPIIADGEPDYYCFQDSGMNAAFYLYWAEYVDVTVSGDGAADAKFKASAGVDSDYTFSVDKAAGYDYAVTAKVGDKSVDVADNGDGTYTVSASALTGALEIEVSKTALPAEWERLYGDGRYDTMAAVVSEGFDSADTVVIASGDNFPDALSAASLAGAYDAPILLTSSTALNDQTASEIRSLGATKAIVVGGEAAVSGEVISQISDLGVYVRRISGDTRYETNLKVNAALGASSSDTAIVATGENFGDALAISPFAYNSCSPIYLVDGAGELSDDTAAALREGGYSRILILGGERVVSTATESACEDMCTAGKDGVVRLSGDTRVDTSIKVAEYLTGTGELSYDYMAVAYAWDFPDALTASALCGKNGSVIVLADDESVDKVVGVVDKNKASIEDCGYTIGGDKAVSAAVHDAIVALGFEDVTPDPEQ